MSGQQAEPQEQAPQSFRLDNNRLGALRWGRSDAPVWLALHGWLDNAASYSRLAPLLVKALDIQLVAIEFSGHGHSLWRPGGRYFLWDYVEDALAAMNALELPAPPVVIGHSLGAAVAVQLAGALPERVERLVLLDGMRMKSSPATDYPNRLKKALVTRQRDGRLRRPYRTLEQALWARVAGAITPVDEATIGPVVERSLRTEGEGLVLRSDSAVSRPTPATLGEGQWQALMQAIRGRVDIIAASQGILDEESRHFAKAFRNHHWHDIEGGHHVHLEPARVAEVARLIQGLEGITLGSEAGRT